MTEAEEKSFHTNETSEFFKNSEVSMQAGADREALESPNMVLIKEKAPRCVGLLWALRDSNPRPLLCKRSALTN